MTRLLPLLAAFSLASADEEKTPLTAADYTPREIAGWTVHVENSLDDHPRRDAALELIETNLNEVAESVPAHALPKLRQVPIWLSRHADKGACYHPNPEWLRKNRRVVEMARAIELQNIDHFLDWSATQPSMLLHELAHAWHHRFLPEGYANPDIRRAFEEMRKSARYEKVRHTHGKEQRHYALTNPMEYFAETSEAYFGRNDFHPFNREQLLEVDPDGHALIERMWQVP